MLQALRDHLRREVNPQGSCPRACWPCPCMHVPSLNLPPPQAHRLAGQARGTLTACRHCIEHETSRAPTLRYNRSRIITGAQNARDIPLLMVQTRAMVLFPANSPPMLQPSRSRHHDHLGYQGQQRASTSWHPRLLAHRGWVQGGAIPLRRFSPTRLHIVPGGIRPRPAARAAAQWMGDSSAIAGDDVACGTRPGTTTLPRTLREPHGTESGLTAGELQDLQQELGIPAGGLAAGFDAALGFVGAHQAEREAAHDGHVLGAMARAIP